MLPRSGESACLVERSESAALPLWLEDLLGDAGSARVPVRGEGLTALVRRRNGFTCVEMRVADVDSMDIRCFERAVSDAYLAIFEDLRREATLPIRFWAFIPQLHAGYGSLDRYMVFNGGRFAAYRAWFGGSDAFSRSVPTASAVGCGAGPLALFCLASRAPGTPVENPRQIPAYRYSCRYGPLPPCFSRATLIARENRSPLLLVGGTASIRGERSMHSGDVEAQTLETFRNLGSVVRSGRLGDACPPGELGDAETEQWLALFRELRIYHTLPRHRETVVGMVRKRFLGLTRIEVVSAELCRPELLVEMEGVADLTMSD